MIDLIKELKRIIEERNISPEGASRYIGCAAKSVYRWIQGESVPSLVYRDRIREAIKKITHDFPKPDAKIQNARNYLFLIKNVLHSSFRFKDEKKAISILGDLTPVEFVDIVAHILDPKEAPRILKKFGIEVLKIK